MSQYKIIFTGPVGAGKTTAIQTVSEIPVVKTDVAASDTTKLHKTMTTVAMDYGLINLDGGSKVHLYGTPGQERFDFMWDILTNGGNGLILLLNNSREDPFTDMRLFLGAFKQFIADTKIAIGVTQTDKSSKPTIAEYDTQAKASGLTRPTIFAIDARVKQDVTLLVQSLLHS